MPNNPLSRMPPSESKPVADALAKKIVDLIKASKGIDDATFYETLAHRTGYSVADVRFVVESRISVRVQFDPRSGKDKVQLN